MPERENSYLESVPEQNLDISQMCCVVAEFNDFLSTSALADRPNPFSNIYVGRTERVSAALGRLERADTAHLIAPPRQNRTKVAENVAMRH